MHSEEGLALASTWAAPLGVYQGTTGETLKGTLGVI